MAKPTIFVEIFPVSGKPSPNSYVARCPIEGFNGEVDVVFLCITDSVKRTRERGMAKKHNFLPLCVYMGVHRSMYASLFLFYPSR